MPRRDSWRGRRARRLLLAALGMFLVAQQTITLLLDHALPLLRFPSARAVFGQMVSRTGGPDLVVLGSSRLQEGVLESEAVRLLQGPSRGVNVLNAAVPGGDGVAQRWMLTRLLDAGARPRLVVLEVSPEFLNGYSFFAGANAIRLMRWDDLPRHGLSVARSPQFGRAVAARLVPVYQHREELWKLATGQLGGPLSVPRVPTGINPPAYPPELPDGPPPPVSDEVRARTLELAGQVRTSWLRSYRVAPLYVETFKDMVRRCREAGCEVVALSPPVSSLQRAAYTPEIEAAYRAVIDELGCRHVDCRGWMEDGYFYDSHHLTALGAVHFTRLLTQRVLAPARALAGGGG
jgi:hypothetical protein